MTKPVVNIDEVEFMPRVAPFAPTGPAAERFDVKTARIGPRIGAKQLGYNITAVPPGKRGYPVHSHRVNEEMFFVLEGTGEVRIGSDVYPLKPGDFVACPAGGPELAHQIANTGTTELRYLAVSTTLSPEICDYPDSDKFAVFANFAGPTDDKPKIFRHIARKAHDIDYWDGE